MEMSISPTILATVSRGLIGCDEISFGEDPSPPPVRTKEKFALVRTNNINPTRKNTPPMRVDSVTSIINYLITHRHNGPSCVVAKIQPEG